MIRLESVSHDYGRGPVLVNLDARIATGLVSAVCGANAAGKTTLLRIAAGLLSPTSGRVLLEDRSLTEWSLRERARRCGFMSQRFECSTGFSVRHVLRLAGLATRVRSAEESNLLEALELGALLDRSVGTLSSGQAQRVAFARLLLQCPPDGVLILDEPCAALDPRWTLIFGELLRARAAAGGTILVSIHDLGLVGQIADEVLLLAGTRLAAHAPAEEVLVASVLSSAYQVEFDVLRTSSGGAIPISVRR
ncbi:MAG: hypothetical protein CBC35_00710 [Planctomycetes bacterium TMED75]|nr:hypothetical protein [Planctomycetaceae bacterium]OUU96685.1 MAG: hypothetical protein CBC35_00710 [Planctomycetes bacterium TMED75]